MSEHPPVVAPLPSAPTLFDCGGTGRQPDEPSGPADALPATAGRRGRGNIEQNRLLPCDRPAHEWYRFVLSYPPHLVRDYLQRFGAEPGALVLDPFCGTGTTLVECKKHAIASLGIEGNPLAHFASTVKIDWTPSAQRLADHAEIVAATAAERLTADGLRHRDRGELFGPVAHHADLKQLPAATAKLLLKGAISPVPLHRVLTLLECLKSRREPSLSSHEHLALARLLPTEIGNLHFGPEVGVSRAKRDAPVVDLWLDAVRSMATDIAILQPQAACPAQAHYADARDVGKILQPASVDYVITSPPYPNEKDYTRTTRLESVLLGFLHDRAGLRAMKEGLLRSNTRNVFRSDDDDRHLRRHGV